MPVLRGSQINPSLLDSPLDQVETGEKFSRKQKRVLEEMLHKWREFESTEMGQMCAELADPMIAKCRYFLSLSAADVGYSIDVLNEMRAECRGELRVWETIKRDPDKLKRLLQEMEENTKQDKGSSAPTWQPAKKSEKNS